VHDLVNLGDQDMIFMTVESIEGSANTPLSVPEDGAAEGGVVATPFRLAEKRGHNAARSAGRAPQLSGER
jgi:hypothetical protein